MKNFDWKLSTIEDMAKQITLSNDGTVKQLFAYYKRANNEIMIGRLDKARKLAKVWKLEANILALKAEIGTYD